MDPSVGQLLLASIAGFGAAGVVMSGLWASYAASGDGPFQLRPRWCWPWCPLLFGAVVAAILVLVFGETLDPRGDLLTTGVLGVIGGWTGATLSLGLQGTASRQRL